MRTILYWLWRYRGRMAAALAVLFLVDSVQQITPRLLGWAIASRLQERVSHLALLGSPAPAVVAMMQQDITRAPSTVARSSVAAAGARAVKLLDPDCKVPACGCPYTDDLRRPLSPATRVMAIYTRDDPIVRPAACRVPAGENVEIGGTHGGLVYNRAALPRLGAFLAERDQPVVSRDR